MDFTLPNKMAPIETGRIRLALFRRLAKALEAERTLRQFPRLIYYMGERIYALPPEDLTMSSIWTVREWRFYKAEAHYDQMPGVFDVPSIP